jgi:hypothetical protein
MGTMSENIQIPDGALAASIVPWAGSRYGEDGFVYDLETGERIGKYYKDARANRKARIWVGYRDEHLPDLEDRMVEIQRRSREFRERATAEIVSLCNKSPYPCTKPDANGYFRRFYSVQTDDHQTYNFWSNSIKGGKYGPPFGTPKRTRDGLRIVHLDERIQMWRRRARLFEAEFDLMLSDLCARKFGFDPPGRLSRIEVNGRHYYYERQLDQREWTRLVWPEDEMNEFSLDEWDASRDQKAICRCGHPYFRHFDTYEDMRDVGVKTGSENSEKV